MKFILKSILLVVSLSCCVDLLGDASPSDSDIAAALKKQLVVGKTTLTECEALFGKPVSVVENSSATVYAFKKSAVAKGLKLKIVNTESQSMAQLSSTKNMSKGASEVHSNATKSSAPQIASQDDKNKVQRKLKSEKESVDKIINFVFKDNKLLSYKISSSH